MPKLLYLDLNHWIRLARARLGRPGSEMYQEALRRLRLLVAANALVVPLSSTHYIEISRIRDPKQRAELALTMEEISQYAALTSRGVLLRDELRRSMASEFHVRFNAVPPDTIGFGYSHAFGQGDIRGRITGNLDAARRHAERTAEDFIRRIDAGMGYGWRFKPSGRARDKLELIEEAANAAMQFAILKGPRDEDLERLRRDYGYGPEQSYAVTQEIEKREAELARLLAQGEARMERLDDIIAARAMYWDLGDAWIPASRDLGLPPRELVEIGKEPLTRIINGTPIIDVESAVRRGSFRNGSYTWTINDIYDLSFVGPAVRYCDVVMTDNHVRAQLVQQGVDRKYETALPRRVDDLIALLDEVTPDRTNV